MKASRLGRAWLTRSAVAVAVSALPLFAAGSAQAAIAGAGTVTTANLPDLVSAQVLDPTDVQACFDKTLDNSTSDVIVNAHTDDVFLVGYQSYDNELDPSSVRIDPTKTDCLDLVFDSHTGQLDLTQFSVLSVGAGAVATTGGQTNLADSTTLLQSSPTAGTHNGTRGLTDAPDLVGPALVAGKNAISYVFDQPVDANKIDATKFWFEDSNGNYCFADPAGADNSVAGNTVTVDFDTTSTNGYNNGVISSDSPASSTTCSDAVVANARRAGVMQDGVYDVSDAEIGNPSQGTAMPNNPGTTIVPDLSSATLNPNANTVTFTFDSPVSYNDSSDFFVALSNGEVERGTGTPVGSSSDSLTVSFTNLAAYDEYAVQAGVYEGAAYDTTNPSDHYNSLGTVPIGGNSGAFARGFTTGPDAYAASFTSAGGGSVAAISFDQRVAGYAGCSSEDCDAGNSVVHFLNAAGSDLGSPSQITVPTYPNAGPEAITMQVPPTIAAQKPAYIAISPNDNSNVGYNDSCGFFTGLQSADSTTYSDGGYYRDGCSVPQILPVTGSAAHVKAIHFKSHSVKAHKAHKRHKAHKAHKAHKKA